MPMIDPIDRQTAQAQGLGGVLEAFADMGDPDGIFPRILAHAPKYAQALGDALATSFLDGNVDHRLKEIVRIQLARTAQDPYFAGLRSTKATAAGLTEEQIDAGSRGGKDAPEFTPAERWALRYAHLMYRHPEQVDSGGMIAVHYGMQVFMRTLEDRNP